jgi:hypothetical protein
VAGTDPNDPNSVLIITSLENGNQLRWNSVSNRNYKVWATTNLSSAMQIISPVIHAIDSTTSWSDTSPDPVMRFYRVEVIP